MQQSEEDKKKERNGAGVVLPGASPLLMKNAPAAGFLSRVVGGGLRAVLAGKFGVAAISVGLGAAGMAGVSIIKERASRAPAETAAFQGSRPDFDEKIAKRDAYGSKSLSYLEQANAGSGIGQGAASAGEGADAPAKGEEAVDEADGDAAADGSASEKAGASGKGKLGEALKEEEKEETGDKKEAKGEKPTLVASGPGFGGAGAAGAGGGGSGAAQKAASGGAAEGKLRAMSGGSQARVVTAAGGGSRGGRIKGLRGATAQKLGRMDRAMRTAGAGSDTSAAAAHNSEWAGSTPGGKTLSGAGSNANFSSDEGGGVGSAYSPAGSSGGGYRGGYQDGYNDGGGGSRGTKIQGSNVTPYQQMVDMAKAMLALASVMLLIAGVLGLLAKWSASTLGGLPLAAKLYKLAKYIAYVACAAAAIVTLLGVGIMMAGQTTQGAIFTGVGAVLTILSYVAADSYGEASQGAEQAHTAAEKAVQSDPSLLKMQGADGKTMAFDKMPTDAFQANATSPGHDLGSLNTSLGQATNTTGTAVTSGVGGGAGLGTNAVVDGYKKDV